MKTEVRAAAVRAFSCGLVTGGWAAAKRSSARGRGANVVVVMLMLSFCACASTSFEPYRACREWSSKRQHDPGWVVWEEVRDDGVRHYGFLSDRVAADRRNVVDLADGQEGAHITRNCVLVSAAAAFPFAADQATPFSVEPGGLH